MVAFGDPSTSNTRGGTSNIRGRDNIHASTDQRPEAQEHLREHIDVLRARRLLRRRRRLARRAG